MGNEKIKKVYGENDYPYMSDVYLRQELLGYPAFLYPFTQFTTSARMDMWSSHRQQALILEKSNFPHIFTGFEYDDGQYEHSTTKRKEDVEVLDFIPKFMSSSTVMTIDNPEIYIIYRGVDTGIVSYFVIKRHTLLSDGFGYENIQNNISRLIQKGYYLPKDEVISTSPAHQGNKYCTGVNLNVCYLPLLETSEDAMVLSQSAADKMFTYEYHTKIIPIRSDQRALPLYGIQGIAPNIVPDVGQYVRDDGILCAFRPMRTATCAADLDFQSLMNPQEERDVIIKVPNNSQILDLDFCINRLRVDNPDNFPQVFAYLKLYEHFWNRIIETHTFAKSNGWRISESFNALVRECGLKLISQGKRVPGVDSRGSKVEILGFNNYPVDYIQIKVTYRSPRHVEKGFKGSGREGGKGVFCKICPDDEMPVDDFGIRADILIDPTTGIKRMNSGVYYEPDINRISEFVRRRIKSIVEEQNNAEGYRHAFETLLDWFNDVHPNYATLTRETYTTERSIKKFIDSEIKDGVHLWVPTGLSTMHPSCFLENFSKWADKWNVTTTPLTITQTYPDGTKKKVRTDYPISIGSRYFVLLCKIPHTMSAGVSHVSHQGIASKAGREARYSSLLNLNPVKQGEDENRIGIMDVPVEEFNRYMDFSNSPTGLNCVVDTLLEARYPTRIARFPISNKKLKETNAILGIFHHLNSVIGIETRDTLSETPPPNFEQPDVDVLERDRNYSEADDDDDDDGNDIVVDDVDPFEEESVSSEEAEEDFPEKI